MKCPIRTVSVIFKFFSGIVLAMMTSDQINHLHILRDVAIPNSLQLIHPSHRMRLWSFEEFVFLKRPTRPPLQKSESPGKVKE